MSFNFSDKFALITGGASGIGLAYVKELLKNNIKGIAIVDFNDEIGNKVAVELGNKTTFIRADVSNEKQLAAAFERAKSIFGKLDIVINNAGIMTDAIWRKEIEINSTAVVDGCLLGFKHMGTNNGGNGGIIINTASIVGIEPLTSVPVYSATKAFVISLGRSFGVPFYEKLTNVKVFTICPGMTDTNLIPNVNVLPDFDGLKEYSRKIAYAHYTCQNADNVGKGLIYVINQGVNGTVWHVECDKEPVLIPAQMEPIK